MTENTLSDFFLGFVVGLFIGLMLFAASNSYWHKKLITHGYAEYNPTNGEWQWKEEK